MRLSSTENQIITAMARAFFVSAWADRQDEKGKTYPGQDLMDVAPATPRFVRDYALMFAGRVVSQNDCAGSLLVLLNEAAWADVLKAEGLTKKDVPYRFQRPDLEEKVDALKTDKYVDLFGHYLAMQGMGHGVSWFDDHAKFELELPLVEATLL